MKDILKEKSADYITYCVIGLLCAVVFCSIYGVYILNPTYTDWLMAGGDLSQHYLGWVAYRNSAWHFPIGLVDTLAYPHVTSLIFTDSIPLFALFFKILSPILPESFQYFGLWGIVSFILQGVLTARILKNFTDNKSVIILSAVLFVYTPVMILRMYVHTALAGQWVLLLGLETILASRMYEDGHIYKRACLLGVLSSAVHLYFVLMNGIILVGACLLDVVRYKRVKRSMAVLLVYILSAALIVALFGGFTSGMMASAWGLGEYSLNLNAFVNPQGWSCVLKTIPLYNINQYEGFAYLGAGCIVLLWVAIITFVSNDRAKDIVKAHVGELVALILVVIISVFVAQSPVVTYGEHLLFEIKLPDLLIALWSAFRASGRIAWISVYIFMLCSCIVVLKCSNKATIRNILLFVLILQIFDIHEVLQEKYEQFNRKVEYQTFLQDQRFWNTIAEKNEVRHVFYDGEFDHETMFSVTEWALSNNMTTNNFYFARSLGDIVSAATKEMLREPSKDNLFLFPVNWKAQNMHHELNYYRVDQFVVGYSDEVEGFTPLSRDELCEDLNPGEVISFVADNFNASPYVCGGISNPEEHGTWTLGKKFCMHFDINSDADILQGAIHYIVFNGQQDVVIKVNKEKVYEGIVTGETIIFDFKNPGQDEFVCLEIELPTANSPEALGMSNDNRIIALSMEKIVISEKDK